MVEVPSDDERSREELPFAEAEAMVPLHKQIRVWIGGAAVLGTQVPELWNMHNLFLVLPECNEYV